MIFPDTLLLQSMMAQSGLMNGATFDEIIIGQKFNAAKAQAQRELRVFFEPTEILPNDVPQAEIEAFEAVDTAYYQEAAYDYNPEMFNNGTFGFMVTKQKPLIAVHSIEFAYPSPENVLFTVPKEWIRTDKKYGYINLVPTMLSASIPISSYLLNIVTGGRAIPLMVRLRYRAGITDIENTYPDIIELLNRMTVLSLLKGSFLPSSGTLSVDGISRTAQINMKDWQSSIDDLMDSLRDSIHGVRMGWA